MSWLSSWCNSWGPHSTGIQYPVPTTTPSGGSIGNWANGMTFSGSGISSFEFPNHKIVFDKQKAFFLIYTKQTTDLIISEFPLGRLDVYKKLITQSAEEVKDAQKWINDFKIARL